ncbi:MAG: hypothetical protein DBY04_08875 [Clostridiales bacterium]|nr:MAG: hypothetical protein DBY04_08875 [Clostridiales bacterium]
MFNIAVFCRKFYEFLRKFIFSSGNRLTNEKEDAIIQKMEKNFFSFFSLLRINRFAVRGLMSRRRCKSDGKETRIV